MLEFDLKRLVILASLATIGGFGATRAADATPMPALFRVAPTAEEQSTRITPATERPLLIWGAIAALMQESLADGLALGAVSVGEPTSGTWTSPFPTPVSLRLGKTVVSEALQSIHDPLQLRRR